jgi:serine/threonine protein kinase
MSNIKKDPLKIISSIFNDKNVSIKIIDYINSGSFGHVYKVVLCNGNGNGNDKEYALKIPKIDKLKDNEKENTINKAKREMSSKLIKKEVSIYKKLEMDKNEKSYGLEKISIPEYKQFTITIGSEKYKSVLMTLLGCDLIDYTKKFGDNSQGVFDLRNLILLTIKSITLLKYIHSKGILHQDIKPENILFDKSFENIYLIDFGLSTSFLDKNNNHIPSIQKSFCGTPRYASITSHNFKQQSRKDDLESLCYMLICLYKGDLPWCNIDNKNKKISKTEKYKLIKELKENTKEEELVKSALLPKEYYKMLYYVKNLEYDQKPSYNNLKRMFIELYIKNFGISNITFSKF